MKRTLALALAAAAALLTGSAQADSFLPPSVREARSASGEWVVTVIPASLSCALDESGCEPAARAVIEMEVRGYRGRGRVVRLVNETAPGRAYITDDGARLLTVDDYASYGVGPNVLVVYGEQGEVIARHALGDFLPDDYVNGLPHTVSTLRWLAGEPRIEAGTHRAIIPIVLVGPEQGYDIQGSLDLTLDLDTGEIEHPSGAAFDNALWCARANAWVLEDDAAERAREAAARRCR